MKKYNFSIINSSVFHEDVSLGDKWQEFMNTRQWDYIDHRIGHGFWIKFDNSEDVLACMLKFKFLRLVDENC